MEALAEKNSTKSSRLATAVSYLHAKKYAHNGVSLTLVDKLLE